MGACVLALADAQEHVAKYPSKADDAGTDPDVRTAQHLLTRTLNSLNSKMEISDTQAASALLGFPTEVTSDVFEVYYGKDNFRYAASSSRGDIELDDDIVCLSNKDPSSDNCSFRKDESDQNHERDASEQNELDGLDLAKLLSVTTSDNTCSAEGEVFSDSTSIGASLPDEDGFAEMMTRHVLSGSSESGVSEVYDSPLEHAHVPNEAARSTGYGKGRIFRLADKDSDEIVAVVQAQLYAYRGKGLRMLSRVEYFATIGIRRDKECTQSASCNQSAEFSFGDGCPLKPFYVQYVLRKQKTIIHADSLPSHPGPEPSLLSTEKHKLWEAKANMFAEYYLTAYRPEKEVYDEQSYKRYKDGSSDDDRPGCDYTWNALMSFVQSLKESSSPIDLMRLESIRACVTALKSRYSNREIMRDFRARARDFWSDKEARASSSSTSMNKMSFNPELDEMASGLEVKALLDRQIIEACQHINYCDGQLRALKDLPAGPPGCRRLNFCMDFRSSYLDVIAAKILAYAPDPPALDVRRDSEPCNEEDFLSGMQSRVREFYANGAGSSLNEDQLYIVRMYQSFFCRLKWYRIQSNRRHLRSVQPPDAPIYLLNGGPGTGKSHLISAVTELASHLDVGHVAKCAYMGVAASNIDGSTCSKTFVISFQNKKQEERMNNAELVKKLSISQVEQLRLTLRGDNLVLLIIDEISTVTPSILQIISCRMQQLYNNSLPFGGAAVLMVGGGSLSATALRHYS